MKTLPFKFIGSEQNASPVSILGSLVKWKLKSDFCASMEQMLRWRLCIKQVLSLLWTPFQRHHLMRKRSSTVHFCWRDYKSGERGPVSRSTNPPYLWLEACWRPHKDWLCPVQCLAHAKHWEKANCVVFSMQDPWGERMATLSLILRGCSTSSGSNVLNRSTHFVHGVNSFFSSKSSTNWGRLLRTFTKALFLI